MKKLAFIEHPLNNANCTRHGQTLFHCILPYHALQTSSWLGGGGGGGGGGGVLTKLTSVETASNRVMGTTCSLHVTF